MMNKHFFEIVLVLLASSTIFSLELKLVLFQQRRVNKESIKLLNKLQTSSIQQCLPHRKNFLLPQKAVNPHQYQKGYALTILHETLQQIFNLLGATIALDGWEESHMEKFLIELHQQLEYLETLMGLQADQKSGTIGSENLRLQVKMYFRRIHDYLENQEYSSCAWTIVLVEINRCLFFVLRLTGELEPCGARGNCRL
ncbi:interferon epsilon [Saccopteryx leptura]|uniref:interferon epsilon n=1 Tax=Saccopteryx leptura TaxID=249018 RepID=UPI00339D0129